MGRLAGVALLLVGCSAAAPEPFGNRQGDFVALEDAFSGATKNDSRATRVAPANIPALYMSDLTGSDLNQIVQATIPVDASTLTAGASDNGSGLEPLELASLLARLRRLVAKVVRRRRAVAGVGAGVAPSKVSSKTDCPSGGGSRGHPNSHTDMNASQFFTDNVGPLSDSTCTFPELALLSPLVPKVSWVPCSADHPTFSWVSDDGDHVQVECAGQLQVARDYVDYVLEDGTEAKTFMDANPQTRVCARNYDIKWEHMAAKTTKVPWDGGHSLFLRCGKDLNVRTRYLPEKDKVASMPQEQRPEKLNIVHIQTDAFSRAGFHRPNMGWKETAKLARSVWCGGGEGDPVNNRYTSFIFNRYVSNTMTTYVNMAPMYSVNKCLVIVMSQIAYLLSTCCRPGRILQQQPLPFQWCEW